MSKPRIRWAAGLAGLASSLALAFAAPQPAQAQKVLRVVPHADLKVLDGYQTTATITGMHMISVYDTLFAWDNKLNVQPQMVERHTVSPDNLKYTFTLRPGLKWHDGTAVTTKDIVPSLKRLFARETVAKVAQPYIGSIDPVDDKTFSITLKEPFCCLTLMMPGTSTAYGGMYREKEAMIDPNTPITETIGSGPFKFNKAEWVPGAKVVYDKNTDYVPRSEPPSGIAGGKVVKLDRVEYKVIADAATAFTALGAGEVDLLDQPALDLIPTVEKNPDVVIGNITMLENYGGLRPNVLHPPFNNPKARQALALMVDQTEYAQAAYGDKKYWRTCMSMMVCGGPFGSEAGGDPYRKQNLERARQLLKESGYNGEKIVVIGAADIPSLNALTLMTIENLKKIGANVEPVIADWGSIVTRRSKMDAPDKGGWHIFHTTFGGAGGSNPLTSLPVGTNCDKAWFGWPCDAQAEEIRTKFAKEPNVEKQKVLADELQKRLWEVIPFVPLAQYTQPVPHRKNVTGLLLAPIQVFWNMDKS
jgi:peptide/nickel transport system substrate-binding protein